MTHTDPAQLLAYGLHLGHQKSKVNPKAKRYIHSYQNGTSIIDLIQTANHLDTAKEFLVQLGQEEKVLLVVATKKVAKHPVSELCIEHNIPYFTNKWVGGFLTNFAEVSQNIKKMNDLRIAQTDGSWNNQPKHERTQLEKKLNKIASIYVGVEKLNKLPDALCIIDVKKEKGALKEAGMLGIPVVAVVDTNVSSEGVTYPIPANDDALSSITYLIKTLTESYTGKVHEKTKKAEKAAEAQETEAAADKRVKKSPKGKTIKSKKAADITTKASATRSPKRQKKVTSS